MRAAQQVQTSVFLALFLACTLLVGCGVGTIDTSVTSTQGSAFSGEVFGGQQPIVGAAMQLYAVGTGGNGSTATPLLTNPVFTGAGGAFSISNDYSCPAAAPATPVYLVASGGNPGLPGTVNNTASVEVVALGPCSNLFASEVVRINEATTVAAAWALAPFARSVTQIGSTNSNTTGIANAFLTAQQLSDPVNSNSPGSSIPPDSTMESAKLYSLADVISSCVNSNGTDGTCSTLFDDVTPPGGTTPADTFSAALDVVQNPGNNVAAIFTDNVSSSPPFPGLAQAPNDWTMSITYSTDSYSSGPFANFSLNAFDAQGNFWGFYHNTTATATIGNLTKLNRQYAPLVSVPLLPYTDGNDYEISGLAIDASQNVWLSSRSDGNISGTTVNNTGSVLEFDSSGNLLSGTPGYTSGGILDPWAIAADSNGSIWVGSNGITDNSAGVVSRAGGDVSLFTSNGAAVSPSGGFANFSDFDPGPIAFDSNHTAWFANSILDAGAEGSNVGQYIVSITSPTTTNPTPTVTKTYFPNSYSSTIGVDTNNNVWFASGANQFTSGFNQLGVVNPSGTLVTSTLAGGGLLNATGMAIDPANNIWIANANESQEGPTSNNLANPVTISQFSAKTITFGKALSPAQGYGTDPNVCSSYLTGLLIDSSGSLWVTAGPTVSYQGITFCVDGITTFVGLAAPLKTPILGPPQTP